MNPRTRRLRRARRNARRVKREATLLTGLYLDAFSSHASNALKNVFLAAPTPSPPMYRIEGAWFFPNPREEREPER